MSTVSDCGEVAVSGEVAGVVGRGEAEGGEGTGSLVTAATTVLLSPPLGP